MDIQLSKVKQFKANKVRVGNQNGMSASLQHVRKLVYISIMVTLMAVCSRVSLKIGPVATTLQTLAIGIIGYVLGAKYGVISVIIYILIGAAGIPVFAVESGVAGLIGISGGFIIGFIPAIMIIGFSKNFKSETVKILFGIVALVVLYILGAAWMSLYGKRTFGGWLAFSFTSWGIKDAMSIIVACLASEKIIKQLGYSIDF